jgi:hypothetical protein
VKKLPFGMARPRKAPEERRVSGPNPRMTMAERVEIEQQAAILGISPSDFIRRQALGYRLPATLAVQRHQAAQAVALLRLGVNLNQIAHRMNAGRDAPPDLSDLIARVDAMLDQIYSPGDNGSGGRSLRGAALYYLRVLTRQKAGPRHARLGCAWLRSQLRRF